MAQLDLDIATLVEAGTDVRAAAEALSWHGRPGSATIAGDPTLDDAIERQANAWASTHGALEVELAALAVALHQAAEVFGSAEQRSADLLAALVASAPARPHGATPGSGPLLDTAL